MSLLSDAIKELRCNLYNTGNDDLHFLEEQHSLFSYYFDLYHEKLVPIKIPLWCNIFEEVDTLDGFEKFIKKPNSILYSAYLTILFKAFLKDFLSDFPNDFSKLLNTRFVITFPLKMGNKVYLVRQNIIPNINAKNEIVGFMLYNVILKEYEEESIYFKAKNISFDEKELTAFYKTFVIDSEINLHFSDLETLIIQQFMNGFDKKIIAMNLNASVLYVERIRMDILTRISKYHLIDFSDLIEAVIFHINNCKQELML